MKKFILAIALVALTGAAMAQKAQKSAREQARAARQVEMTDQLKAALAAQAFTFTPFTYTAPYQGIVTLNSGAQTYLEVYPQDISVMIPFAVGVPSPMSQRQTTMLNMPSVPYTYSVKATNDNRYIVTIWLKDVSSENFGATNMALQGMNLMLHFDISAFSGQTTLTITPDFAPASIYTGIVRPNSGN